MNDACGTGQRNGGQSRQKRRPAQWRPPTRRATDAHHERPYGLLVASHRRSTGATKRSQRFANHGGKLRSQFLLFVLRTGGVSAVSVAAAVTLAEPLTTLTFAAREPALLV